MLELPHSILGPHQVGKNEAGISLPLGRSRMSASEEQVMPGEEEILAELEMLEQEEEKEPGKSQDPLAALTKHHPESILDYQEVVLQKLHLQAIPPDSAQTPDPNHRSQPFLTQYEKTRILGFRTNQLAQGALPYVSVPAHIRNVLDIAKMELEQRRLPFILKRPMPDGTFEYWRLCDLMIL